MAFTEFYCDPLQGSNLSSGSTNAAPVYSGVGDSDGTSVFTPSDGSTPASTVSAGMFASIYVTIGATVAVFVGRVTAVGAGANGAITVSTTAKSGTIPASSAGAHTITCVVGGYWLGPNAAVSFPFGFITNTLTDVAGDIPRVTLLNSATYSITAAMTHGNAGITFQGATATPGDGGRAVIDGGTSGTSYILLSVTGSAVVLQNLTFQNNGATGSANGMSLGGVRNVAQGCVFNSVRGSGLQIANSGFAQECEAYGCNQSNTSSLGGFQDSSGSSSFLRCYSHDNSGGNAHGFVVATGTNLVACVADSNGGNGLFTGGTSLYLIGCEVYNNAGDGLNLSNGNACLVLVQNSNFVKNGGYGINVTGGLRIGNIFNCGFGSGTQANTSGQINGAGGIQVVGSITYASGVTPWVAPASGNFSINLPAAENTGRGSFTETGSGKSGTVGYPDVGAAPHNAAPIGQTTGARSIGTY